MKIKLFVLLTLITCSCAQHQEISECVSTSPSGFLNGLLQGFISPITLIISWFSDSVEMYDINNNGGWYDLGFALGAGIILRESKGK